MTRDAGTGPVMPDRQFGLLAAEVSEVLDRHNVAVWACDDRDRLDEMLWHFIHPDLAGTVSDPWAGEEACS